MERKASATRMEEPMDDRKKLDIDAPSENTSTLKKEDKLRHKCDSCGQAFSSKEKLVVHLKSHIKVGDPASDILEQIGIMKKPFKCFYCNARFPARNSLAEHERRHTGVSLHRCSLCIAVMCPQRDNN